MRAASDLGYVTLRLGTAPELHVARSMRASMGFRTIASCHECCADTICFEIDRAPPGS